jgi:formylglycine-generating enzyme required for sulfatase activity
MRNLLKMRILPKFRSSAMRKLLSASLVWIFFVCSVMAERVALVIGNNAYQHSGMLKNAVNDATGVAGALRAAGFEVSLVTDAGHKEMEDKVKEFRHKAQGADAAWFYYSGHGMEVKGGNYLVPVDALLEDEYEVKHKTLALDQVLDALDEAGTPLKVVVLDCCRNNPIWQGWKSVGGGLGQVGSTPKGTIIAFAAAPGKVALDGKAGGNSPYTEALLQALRKPGLDIDQMFKETGRLVLAATNKKQQPWINSSFFDSFVLIPGKIEPNPVSESVLDQGAVGKAIQVKLPGEVLMKFAYCPPGSFMMGSSQNPVQVQISKGFWMAITEVTQRQWKALMSTNPSFFKSAYDGDDLPVESVSWQEAQEFITKMNQSMPLTEGWVYALPTEAQWEYACRAGTESSFHFGDALNGTQANCDGSQPYGASRMGPNLQKTIMVGSYSANAWGLYDMHGNVWEWCRDWHSENLAGGTDPAGPSIGSSRIHRGGSWSNSAQLCRAAHRCKHAPDSRFADFGFRVAVVPNLNPFFKYLRKFNFAQ